MDNEFIIKVDNITKSFKKVKALNNLSFKIKKGSITGFIGPNGAGKTTTLRILATLLKPDKGVVKINNIDLKEENYEKIRKNIGFMPDFLGLYENMKVQEYLDFFAAAYHIPYKERENIVESILELIGLKERKENFIYELSKGMKQRLGLGRVLIHEPSILLLDEPAAGLDPRARIELIALLKELKKLGKTIFISSHILSELKELCDDIIIINKGTLIYEGSLEASIEFIEKKINKLRKIYIIFKNSYEENIKDIEYIKDIEGIKNVKLEKDKLILEFNEDKIQIYTILKILLEKGLRIEEVQKERLKLDDVFLILTSEKK